MSAFKVDPLNLENISVGLPEKNWGKSVQEFLSYDQTNIKQTVETTFCTLWRDLLDPAFMVTLTKALPGLLAALTFLVVRTNPLLLGPGVTPTALVLTKPLYLNIIKIFIIY